MIDNCPFCNHKADYRQVEALCFAVICPNCGCSGPKVMLPSYWSKGGFKLEIRLFFRALKPWNRRDYGRVRYVDGDLKKRENNR